MTTPPNHDAVDRVQPHVDHAKLRALGLAAGAVLLLIAYGCQVLPAAPFEQPPMAAATVEDIADRLRSHLDDRHLADGPRVAQALGSPLLSACQDETGLRPPMGVPAYTADLEVAELPTSLQVRFWLLVPEGAKDRADAARPAAGRCAGGRPDTIMLPFNREGWHGTQLMSTAATSPDMGDVATKAYIVAARGQFLAEVSWYWPIEQGDTEDPHWVGQGTAAATAALAAVGGPAEGPIPMPPPQPGTGVLAATLPPPSAYGAGVKPWTGTGEQLDLTCTYTLNSKQPPAAVPAVSRILTGPVTVHEDVLLMPDMVAAEKARRLLVTPEDDLKDDVHGKDIVDPCADDDEAEPVRIPYKVEPFTRGAWTGEMESLAVRRATLPRDPTYKDSVAHVAVVVRRGITVVRLSWQGPAGTDLAAAVREGRTAVTRTLDLLPAD